MEEKDINLLLDLSEEEVLELTAQVNLIQAEELLFDKIEIFPDAIAIPRKPRRHARRAVFLAAVLILCLFGTVFAYQQGYLEFLFGSGVNDGKMVRVAEKQESGGIRMTLAELAYGKTEVLAAIAFERKDGKPFPGRIEFGEFRSSGKKYSEAFDIDQPGNMADGTFINNQKTFLYSCALKGSDRPLYGETLTISADSLIGITTKEKELDIDLAKLHDTFAADVSIEDEPQPRLTGSGDDWTEEEWAEHWREQEEYLKWYDKVDKELLHKMKAQAKHSAPITMPLSKEYPEIRFEGMGFRGDSLCFSLRIPWPTSGMTATEKKMQNLAFISALKDSRDGTIHPVFLYGPEPFETEAGETSYTSKFEGLTPEDLPYLKPIVTYELKELISDGSWGFSYTFGDDGLAISRPLDLTYTTSWFAWEEPQYQEKSTYQLNEMEISVFSLILSGSCGDTGTGIGAGPDTEPTVKLLLKDGKEIPLRYGGITYGEDHKSFKLRYEYPPLHDNSKPWGAQFIDREFAGQIKDVIVNGETIPLQQ